MNKTQKIILLVATVAVLGGGYYFLYYSQKPQATKQIDLSAKPVEETTGPANTGPVNPISGLSCDNWNRRPIAVMQPADLQARPASGFSKADMVVEMPAFTSSNTRLMGIYGCNTPEEVGSLRSSRHDYIAIAGGLDAIFVHWGGSAFAHGILNKNVIDNINELGGGGKAAPECFFRKDGFARLEDSGYAKGQELFSCAEKFGYRKESKFSGYPHQEEAAADGRPDSAHLRLAYPGIYEVEYDYDKASNSFLRTWGNVPDKDRIDGQRVAPKNIAVVIAKSEQIKLSSDFKSRGVEDPWELVPEEERAGLDYGGVGRYNNMEIGDPWFDSTDTGQGYFFLNGQMTKGTWKKDKSKIDSKLAFYDESGKEIKFVPGQIWVEIMEPGQVVEWNDVKMNI